MAWGTNNAGQCSVPAGLSNVVAIAAGGAPYGTGFSVALREDGTFVQWGYLSYVPPTWLHDLVAIAAGAANVVAIRVDGSVIAWGEPGTYQSNVLDVPAAATNAVSVVAGASAAILTGDGRMVRWPYDQYNHFTISAAGYVGLTFGFSYNIVGLRSDGTTDIGLQDVIAFSGGGQFSGGQNFIASIFGAGRLIWLSPNNIVVPGISNAFAISMGYSHFLALTSSGPSRTATAKPKVVNGFVVGIDVVDGGNNYDEVPTVSIFGGGGSGAAATAQVVDGVVTGLTVTSAGYGYTQDASVQIASPWFDPTVTVTTNATRFKITADLVPDESYVLESSPDFISWTSSPFIANTNLLSMPLDPTMPANFVRLLRNP